MNKTYNYEKLMKKCIVLAKKSKGKNLPNPYVGAIIYDEKKDEIISFGFHKKYGENHAEREAIEKTKKSIKNKTLIVNLEPCSHYGKTPPCTDLIIKSGIKKVIIGMIDVNPIVQNNGINKLKNAGIEVITGVLEKECKKLNKIFIKNMTEKKPYIMLKTAATLDSRIATKTKKSKWITNEKSRLIVQKLRNSYCAIMSTSGTILEDNPYLTVRLKNKNPLTRIIFDPNNKIPLDYNVFNNDGNRIILINYKKRKAPDYIEQVTFEDDFNKLFKKLYEMKIYSIMVEAGSKFNSLLLKNKEIDEINYFIAPKIFGSGINFVDDITCNNVSDCIKLEDIKIKKIKDDILINGFIKS